MRTRDCRFSLKNKNKIEQTSVRSANIHLGVRNEIDFELARNQQFRQWTEIWLIV